MSTFYDYHFRCEGDSKLVAKAAAAIKALQDKNPEVRGSSHCHIHNEVEVAKNGKSMNWTCYTKGVLEDLEDELAALTADGELKLFIYQGCTDGTNEGRLLEIVGNEIQKEFECEADIGLQAMVDILALQEVEDSKAMGRLIAGLKDQTRGFNPSFFNADEAVAVQNDDEDDDDEEEYDEDDDGDYTEIMRSGVLAAMTGDALDMHPSMLDMSVHSKALSSMAVRLSMVRHYMFKYKFASKPVQNGINSLIAKVEKLTLSKAVALPKFKAIGTTRNAVRL